MTTQIEITQRNHHRAVRFFWCFLGSATTVSLIGNIAHAVLSYLPRIVIQIGAAAVPPIASSPPCTASPSPSVPEPPAGFTAGRSALLPPSA
jgi:hypothetical protein